MGLAGRNGSQRRQNLHLNILGIDGAAGSARAPDVCGCDEGGQDEGDGGEEAKGALDSVQGVVHGRRGIWRAPNRRRAKLFLEKLCIPKPARC